MAHESGPCPCGIGNRFDCDGCGKEVQVEHFKAYVCKPPASTDKAVVVIHDIFAWQLPNTRHMDTFSHMANESRPCPCDIGERFDYGSRGQEVEVEHIKVYVCKSPASTEKAVIVIHDIFGWELPNTRYIADMLTTNGYMFDYGGRGQEVQVEHIKAYVCKPPASTEKAVIVIHDIFGWELPNTRYIADMLTANGYIAICPDFFVGQEAWKPSNDWAVFKDWLKTREASKIDKEVAVVLKYLREQCGAKEIGVIGFCWGGAAVQHLMLKNPHMKTGVSLHGVIRYFESRSNLLHPTFFIFAEKDDHVPLEEVTLLEQKLKQNCKVDYEVKIYPGQTHGFVHRKREDINPQDKPFIEEARKDMINWLNKYL